METFSTLLALVRGNRSPVIHSTKASNAELWCFIWYVPEQTVESTIDTPVIGEPSRSLWRQCDVCTNIQPFTVFLIFEQDASAYVMETTRYNDCRCVYHFLRFTAIFRQNWFSVELELESKTSTKCVTVTVIGQLVDECNLGRPKRRQIERSTIYVYGS